MIRAPIPDLAPGERRLVGPVAHYLARVLRLRAGHTFVAFDPACGRVAEATTVWVGEDAIVVRFGAMREPAAREKWDLFWIQGLAKGSKCDAVVRDATELEATQIVVAQTERSVVRLDAPRAADRQARWARIAREAARQCGRIDVPTVHPPCSWGLALAHVPNDAARFCLWERATAAIGPLLFDALTSEAALAFACGPEGGLEDHEVETARASGWTIASLGRTTLRTETVAAAVLGAVRIWTATPGP